MEYNKKFTKDEAIHNAKIFLQDLRLLEEKHSMNINSDRGDDIYLSYMNKIENGDVLSTVCAGEVWGSVKIGWVGDGTGLKVQEKTEAERMKEIWDKACALLSEEEREALGLKRPN